MKNRIHFFAKVAAAALMLLLLASVPAQAGSKSFDGRWVFTIAITATPFGHVPQILTVTLDVSPRGDSLNGRLTVTDSQNRTVSGGWRQVGKRISVTYELPCPDD